MELHSKNFAAAVLLLLLGASATDGVPLDHELGGVPGTRTTFDQAASEVGLARQEGAGALNTEEEEEQAAGPLSWESLLSELPHQGEPRNSGGALSLRKIKDKWEGLLDRVMKQVQASAGNEKVPALLQKLNDPEVRTSLLTAGLGAAGMAATGLMLGDKNLIRDVSLMSLYVTALMQLIKSGASLATKLASDASGARADKTDEVRQKLVKLFGLRPENDAAGEADEQ